MKLFIKKRPFRNIYGEQVFRWVIYFTHESQPGKGLWYNDTTGYLTARTQLRALKAGGHSADGLLERHNSYIRVTGPYYGGGQRIQIATIDL